MCFFIGLDFVLKHLPEFFRFIVDDFWELLHDCVQLGDLFLYAHHLFVLGLFLVFGVVLSGLSLTLLVEFEGLLDGKPTYDLVIEALPHITLDARVFGFLLALDVGDVEHVVPQIVVVSDVTFEAVLERVALQHLALESADVAHSLHVLLDGVLVLPERSERVDNESTQDLRHELYHQLDVQEIVQEIPRQRLVGPLRDEPSIVLEGLIQDEHKAIQERGLLVAPVAPYGETLLCECFLLLL